MSFSSSYFIPRRHLIFRLQVVYESLDNSWKFKIELYHQRTPAEVVALLYLFKFLPLNLFHGTIISDNFIQFKITLVLQIYPLQTSKIDMLARIR